MLKYILSFEEIKKEDINTAGGKGANLGEMTAAGINIPKGAVILAQAYDKYMSENDIYPEKYENGKELREAIVNAEIPSEMKKEIEAFYEGMGKDARVAVRSSATAEDLDDASFAGQQETYLNVIGRNDLFEKIKLCYASLWGDRAVSYRKNSGHDKEKVALAVVIQEMVESEAAGVMFTSDPAGDPENIHINASYGLGEAVVSGIVSPDEYICDREGKLIMEFIGSKETEILYKAGKEGTIRIPVSEERRKQRVLGVRMISALAKEGIRIEKHYGHPMDIEWAVKDGKIYILQARSITTLKKDEGKNFTEADFASYPKVEAAKGSMREAVLFNMEKNPTPYYPLDHDFGGFIGEQKNILFTEIGITFVGGMNPIDKDGISYLATGKMKLNKNIFSIFGMLKKVNNIDNNIRCADASLEKCRREYEEESKHTYTDIKETGKALKRMHDLIGRTSYDRFLYALFPNALESNKVTKVLKKVDSERNAYDILEGLNYVTADINRAMKELCEYIIKDKRMTESVMKDSYQTISSAYPELGEKLSEFIQEYGSKSDFNCYCFVAETWRENPDRFINTLRPMLKDGGKSVATKEESIEHYEKLMQRVKKALSEKKYADFEKRVNALRHYHYIREATQYLWESEFEYCRKLLKKLSELTKISYNDLMFLFEKELYEACEKGDFEEKKKLIAARKEKRAFAEAYWDKCMKDALAGEGDTVKGIGASNGSVKGKVCIVHSSEEFYKLEKGDILVCTYTDPEWTPLFALAAGVVVDTGGTLSHAAIVAREYNIPAVLATGDATLKLKDGDRVLVDASTGSVTILA
ncbi:MAG: phosphoenolpyruvate synthase [Lachnospiraceae bacterium]|nr:phosphoenolpyruvate synthase [Lachnospiraceae bacterium]